MCRADGVVSGVGVNSSWPSTGQIATHFLERLEGHVLRDLVLVVVYISV